MIGKLQKKDDRNWVVDNTQVHEQHFFWLKIFGENDMEVNYIIEDGIAILKSNGPDTHEYTQD